MILFLAACYKNEVDFSGYYEGRLIDDFIVK